MEKIDSPPSLFLHTLITHTRTQTTLLLALFALSTSLN